MDDEFTPNLNLDSKGFLDSCEFTTSTTSNVDSFCLACGSCYESPTDDSNAFNSDTAKIKVEPVEHLEDLEHDEECEDIPVDKVVDEGISTCRSRSLLLKFCELLGVKLIGIELNTWESSRGEHVTSTPFCGHCQNRLRDLLEVQVKLKKLEREFETGITDLKKMCERAEAKFSKSGIYDRDTRYLKIRRQICPVKVPKRAKDSSASTKRPRRSGRKKKPTSYLDPDPNDSNDSIQDRVAVHDEKPVSDLIAVETALTKSIFEEVEEDPLDTAFEDPASPQQDKDQIPAKKPKVGKPKRSAKKKKGSKSKSSRKQSKPEDDYNPQNDDDDDNGEKSEDDDGEPRVRMTTDPVTGHVSWLNVTFKKLDNGRYHCLECDKNFLYTSVKNHVISRHTDMYVCSMCGRHTGSSKDLKKHVLHVHQGESRKKDLMCPICGKPHSFPYRLKKHMVSHLSPQEREEAIARGEKLPQWSNTNKHVCEECGKGFDMDYLLLRHKLKHHPSETYTEEERLVNKEMCPDCGKLLSKSFIKTHRQMFHSNEVTKRFICSTCDKRFFKETDLRKHKKAVHEKLRPWKCPTCPREFGFPNHLKMHINVCQNIRPFKCEHCPMAFGRKSHLVVHFKKYHEEGATPRRHKHLANPAIQSQQC